MYSVKQKVSDAASSAKAHVETYKAKAEEKVEKATARTAEEKEIAHERRKAKEAEAKMRLHEEKAEHAAQKLHGKHFVHHQPPVVGGVGPGYNQQPPVVGGGVHHHQQQPAGTVLNDPTAAPAGYPLGGHHLPGQYNNKY